MQAKLKTSAEKVRSLQHALEAEKRTRAEVVKRARPEGRQEGRAEAQAMVRSLETGLETARLMANELCDLCSLTDKQLEQMLDVEAERRAQEKEKDSGRMQVLLR